MSQRTVVGTGSAGGIGLATCDNLRDRGCRVIGVDVRAAEVLADLGTRQGRADLVPAVRDLAPDGIDGIVANAGVHRPDSLTIRVNYSGRSQRSRACAPSSEALASRRTRRIAGRAPAWGRGDRRHLPGR